MICHPFVTLYQVLVIVIYNCYLCHPTVCTSTTTTTPKVSQRRNNANPPSLSPEHPLLLPGFFFTIAKLILLYFVADLLFKKARAEF